MRVLTRTLSQVGDSDEVGEGIKMRVRQGLHEVEINLRPTVSRPVCPGVGRPSGTRDQFFFLLEISIRQLRLCCFVAPSLTRGRVCNLLVQLLLGLARAVTLVSKSRRTHGQILLSRLRLPQPGEPGPRIYIPQSQSQSYFTTDGQSVSMSWCRTLFGTFDQRYFFF
jgi:hypothetical protein